MEAGREASRLKVGSLAYLSTVTLLVLIQTKIVESVGQRRGSNIYPNRQEFLLLV